MKVHKYFSIFKTQKRLVKKIATGFPYLVALDLKLVGHALQTAEASHGLAMLNLNLLFGGDLIVLGLRVRSAALIVVIVDLVALAIDIQLMTIGAAHSVLVVKIRPLFSL